VGGRITGFINSNPHRVKRQWRTVCFSDDGKKGEPLQINGSKSVFDGLKY